VNANTTSTIGLTSEVMQSPTNASRNLTGLNIASAVPCSIVLKNRCLCFLGICDLTSADDKNINGRTVGGSCGGVK
jgi:hypothetical protein